MVPLLPAQLGIPGGIELAIIFLIFLLLAVPVVLLVLAIGYLRQRGASEDADRPDARDERIADLEAEVEMLRAHLEAERE